MELLTEAQRAQMLANGQAQREANAAGGMCDHLPVVKLFTPDASATWLLTELHPNDPDIAFGLCDLGMGCPELGYVSLQELAGVRGLLGLPVERDLHFQAQLPLSGYADLAYRHSCIVTHLASLEPPGRDEEEPT